MLRHLIILSVLFWTQASAAKPCAARDVKNEQRIVCVCNATYCDTVEPTTTSQLAGKTIRHYITSKAGKRLSVSTMAFASAEEKSTAAAMVTVMRDVKYQEIYGFGGAPTDSASYNIKLLSAALQEQVLKSYFGPEGIGYTFLRVPVAGCDFSLRYYEYDDNHAGDAQLKFFNLSNEDYLYKIPVIKRAQQLAGSSLKLFSAPWSAPEWMKNIVSTTKASSLKSQYYSTYANYYVKFLQMYEKQGIKFWGLSPQNEPYNGLTSGGWNTMGWQPETLRNWLVSHLAPSLHAAGFNYLKIMVLDDSRGKMKLYADLNFGNSTVSKLVHGGAYHWYDNNEQNLLSLAEIHKKFPDKFLLATEACYFQRGSVGVIMGDWGRAAKYLSSIISDLSYWSNGWIEWNLALDEKGGPSWFGNSADAPIITNKNAGEIYKQPMFYAIAHFSKFVVPGSHHVKSVLTQTTNLEAIAFQRPDNMMAVVLHNLGATQLEVVLKDSHKGEKTLQLPAYSVSTVLYM
ncbi:lysosomal acid glucosylceramidase-like [Bacillus rossius redtenbacheri]|uniref:lysosomal acid glucosylceramidase-like n=1 Tax=Bacillus rossius redtenbacheri TaxID=93214 RepID=UPI002FDE513F